MSSYHLERSVSMHSPTTPAGRRRIHGFEQPERTSACSRICHAFRAVAGITSGRILVLHSGCPMRIHTCDGKRLHSTCGGQPGKSGDTPAKHSDHSRSPGSTPVPTGRQRRASTRYARCFSRESTQRNVNNVMSVFTSVQRRYLRRTRKRRPSPTPRTASAASRVSPCALRMRSP